LQRADLNATDLSHAFLWRTKGGTALGSARVKSISLPDAPETWQPLWRDEQMKVGPWNERAYQNIRHSLNSLEDTSLRNEALDRLRRLDCTNPDPTLASYELVATPTAETIAWQKSVEDARIDEANYDRALAVTLERLVCSGSKDARDILRGLLKGPSPRLDFTGPVAPELFNFIMTKDCLVSASLTDADRTDLLDLKQGTFFKPGG
jgi:hypothetical protein